MWLRTIGLPEFGSVFGTELWNGVAGFCGGDGPAGECANFLVAVESGVGGLGGVGRRGGGGGGEGGGG